MLLLTTVMVNDSGTPGAVVVELPKLLRMSLRTMPLDDNMLLTEPLTELEPSEGYGPFVSVGSAMHAVVLLEELLDEDELLDELLEELLDELLEEELLLLDEELLEELPLSLELPPQAARKAAAPPEASQPNIWRRWRICSWINSRSCRNPASWSWGVSALIVTKLRAIRSALILSAPAGGG